MNANEETINALRDGSEADLERAARIASDGGLDLGAVIEAQYGQLLTYAKAKGDTPLDRLRALRGLTSITLFEKGPLAVPPAISHLDGLRELLVAGNPVTGMECVSELELTKLVVRGAVGIDFLDDLPTSLQVIDLEKNEFDALPASIARFSELTELRISHPTFQTLPDEITQLEKLTKLFVRETKLAGLPQAFGSLSSLRVLNLEQNELSELPESFGGLANLEKLLLQENELTGLPSTFSKLTSLRTLFASKNQISELPEGFGKLSALREVYLDDNPLTTLPDSFFALPKGCFISLEDTPLDEPTQAKILSTLTSRCEVEF